MIKSAVLSPSKTYRYELRRIWDARKAPLLFVMLNPSTADSRQDDPTIRRCMGFAGRLGYGGILVGNLFALRSTDPTALRHHVAPVGPDNDRHLRRLADLAGAVVVAWGSRGTYLGRDRAVDALLRRRAMVPQCLGVTKVGGHPRHPLYVRNDTPFEPWSAPPERTKP